MNHWENGPAFPLREWLGQQKDIPTREYLPRDVWLVDGKVTGRGVRTLDGPGTGKP